MYIPILAALGDEAAALQRECVASTVAFVFVWGYSAQVTVEDRQGSGHLPIGRQAALLASG